ASQIQGHLGKHSSNGKPKRVPFSEEFLEENSQKGIFIRGMSISIEELYKKSLSANPHLDIFGDAWFIRERFATEKRVDSAWYFIQKMVNPASLNKPYDEAKNLLGIDEGIPEAHEIFYIALSYYLIYHKHLFKGYYPFSQNVFMGNRLLVGFFSKKLNGPLNQLDVRHYAGVLKSENIGIVSVKKAINLPKSSV
ncbi:MAG: hypothetical protein HY219_02810, partial [Candidatus Staskawiczbacteria bacterium]|nr:hypothetical protein [Candidatus Staskawiczbacteria bacterium]